MPTGYTAKIHDGDQSFIEFAKSCARAFGSFAAMRDEPADAPIREDLWEPSSYHREGSEKAAARLAELNALTPRQWEERASADYEKLVGHHQDQRARMVEMRARYEDMILTVQGWEPPTPEHVAFKDFMVQQLRESIRFDCYEPDLPPRKFGKEWYADQCARARNDLAYHEREYDEEVERLRKSKQWVEMLWASLATYVPIYRLNPAPPLVGEVTP